MTLERKINLNRVLFTLESRDNANTGAHFVAQEAIAAKGAKGFYTIVESRCEEINPIKVTKKLLVQGKRDLNKKLDLRFATTPIADYFLIGGRVVERNLQNGEIAIYAQLGNMKTRGEKMIRYLEDNFHIGLARAYRETMQENMDFRKGK
ncbi:MAG: hypothetical protein WCK29_00535 [archaeon]